MTVDRREPVDMDDPDTDLDLPAMDMAPPEFLGPLAKASADIAPPAPHGGSGGLIAPVIRPRGRAAPEFGKWLYLMALVASFLWAALSVFAVGYQWPVGTVEFQPYQTAVFGVLAVIPICFFWIAAYCVRQGARLAAEVVRTKTMAEDMLEPAAIAIAEAGSAVEGVRLEIEAATAVAANARDELLNLRQALAQETQALSEAAATSARTARELGENLGREREEMASLAQTLDAQSTAVTEAITRQAHMVTDASDLAQTQIGEAEAALAARAADLAAAAVEAGDAARTASEDLSRQVVRLETATEGVSQQIASMEDTLTSQRASLVAEAHAIRADHEDFSVKVETHNAQLAEVLDRARESVGSLNDTTTVAIRSLADLGDTAANQVQDLADTAKAERDMLAASALQSLGAVSEAARFERESLQADADRSIESMAAAAKRDREGIEIETDRQLAALTQAARMEREALEAEAQASMKHMSDIAEQTAKLAEDHNDAARLKIEALSEAAFAASQKADAAFQSRLDDATALIARSGELMDEAAAKSAERIETAGAHARATLDELHAAIAKFEAQAADLPAHAQARAEELKATIAGGFDGLLASARAAAEETQAIDQAFQERVKRNYEMLSEAVRLMGVVSSRPAPEARPPRAVFAPDAAPRPAPVEARTPAPARIERPARPEPEPAAEPGPVPEPTAAQAGLRPRLKLSPTSADAQVSNVFEAAGEPPAGTATPEAAPGGGWTWQELLSSMNDAPVDEAQLTDRLIGEIEGLGVDLGALLPRARIDEITTVMAAGDVAGARTVVRHLAPAAVRRLSRRTLAEQGLRGHAERFVKRYADIIDNALEMRDQGAPAVVALLSTDEGRTFLLFDAALGYQR